MPRIENLNQTQKAQLEDLKNKNSAKQAQEKYLARPEGAPENTAPERDPEVLQAWAEDLKNRTESGEKRKDNDLDASGKSAEEPRTMIDLAEGDKKISKQQEEAKEDILDVLIEQQGKQEDKPKQDDVMDVLRGQLGDKQEKKTENGQDNKEDIIDVLREQQGKAEEKWEMPEGAQGVPMPYEKGRKDKTIEELLKDLEGARKKFALAEIDFNKFNKKSRKVGLNESVSDNYNQAKSEYKNIINSIRAEKMMRVKMELGESNLAPEQTKQELQKRAQDILKETLVSEAIELNDLEQNLRLEQRGAFGRGFEKAWKSVLGVSEKYQKMPLKKKIMIAGGLMAAGATAGLAGGIFAGAIGGGVIAARWTQRVLSGVGLFRGIEGITKRSQEKRTEKDITKEFSGEDLIQILSNGDEALNHRLFELNKQRDKDRVRRNLLAAGGAIVGGLAITQLCGWATGRVKNIFGWGGSAAEAATLPEHKGATISHETAPAPATEAPPVETGLPAPPENFSATYEVSQGGAVWNGLEEKLGERYGTNFKDLSKGQKDYIIDKWKDYVGAHKEEFGLKDINKIKAGDKIDFSKIFDNSEGMTKTFEEAGKLSPKQIEDIEKYRDLLKQVQVKDSHIGVGHAVAETVNTLATEAPISEAPEGPESLQGAYGSAEITNAEFDSALADQFREAGIQDAMTDKLTEIGLDLGQWEMYKGRTVSDVLAMNPEGRKWGIFPTRDSALERLQGWLSAHSRGHAVETTVGDFFRKEIEGEISGS